MNGRGDHPEAVVAGRGPGRAVTDVRAVKVRSDGHVELPDRLATEEPLEIRAAGPGQATRVVAVTMRTPGHDFELAAGFLVTEGLVRAEQIAGVGYCAETEPEHRWNTVTVALRVRWDPDATRRDFVVTSSCGVCGKAGIDQVERACPALPVTAPLPATLIPGLPDRLRAAQRVFDRTGGLHAAATFDRRGELGGVREDVGRHNAVDKVVGHGALHHAALHRAAGRDRRPTAEGPAGIVVSGRVSFEIVQKAAMAGLPVIAAVSAPSSLAVEAAERLGVTVAAFVRNGSYTLYTHPERIDLDA